MTPTHDGRSRILISAAGPAMWPVLRLARRTFDVYARRHGYDLRIHPLADSRDRSSVAVRAAKWRKVSLLREALDQWDLVLWIDADAVVVQFDRDIADELPPDCFQALALERFPNRLNPNTGVWLLRSERRSRDFLSCILDVGQLPHSWADQATVCRLLGFGLGDHHGVGARHIRSTPAAQATAWLAPEWNAVSPSGSSVRIRHFAGMPLEERSAEVAAAVQGLEKRGALQ